MATLRIPQRSQTEKPHPNNHAQQPPAETDGDDSPVYPRSFVLSAAKRRNHRQITTLRARQRSQTEKPYPNNHAERPPAETDGDDFPVYPRWGPLSVLDPPKPSAQRHATQRSAGQRTHATPASEPTTQRPPSITRRSAPPSATPGAAKHYCASVNCEL